MSQENPEHEENAHKDALHMPSEKAKSPASGITPRRKKILLWSAVAVAFCVLGGLLCTLAYRDDLLKHYAGKNDVSMTRLMLTLGADPETKTKNGSTPLLVAGLKGHEAVMRLLLDKGANVGVKDKCNQTAYDLAKTAAIAKLLKKATQSEIISEQLRTNTPDALLIEAAKKGHDKIASLLIDEQGADIEAKDTNGETPLHWAALNSHEAVARLLLEKSANSEAKDTNGFTPLHWAAAKGHKTVVQLLLDKGANIEAKNTNGETPLHWAALNSHEAVARLLLEKGSNVEAKAGTNGETPLHWAALNGHEAVVRLLLEKGANVEAKNNDGRTAYDVAKTDDIKQLIRSHQW